MYPLTPMSFIKIFISEAFSFAFPEVNSIEPIVSRTRSTYLRDKADTSLMIFVSRAFAWLWAVGKSKRKSLICRLLTLISFEN